MSLLHQLCPEIENHAIVINWDQRGAGKSFNIFSSQKYLNVDQLVSDAHVLTLILKEKYNTDKIVLMGFSWGSALGLLLADKYPEDYSCFISIAQIVNGFKGEQMSLEFVKKEANLKNDKAAIKELNKIKYDFNDHKSLVDQVFVERKYLLKYGGVYKSKSSYGHEAASLFHSKEYSFFNFLLWPMGSNKSLRKIWPEVLQLDFKKNVPTLNIPIIFFTGKYDMNDPFKLVKEYFEFINAPKGKELVVFENSAHGIFWDEPSRFAEEVIKKIETYKLKRGLNLKSILN
jgi:pimeloyl-ACP methyl ester carboxylesterase